MRTRSAVFAVVVGLVLVSTSTSQASHHLWRFTQIFSNASGTVQFAELMTSANNEPNVGAHTITAGGNTFNFVANLTGPATWMLVATSNFATSPGGVTPDYIIPANFFSTGGGTLNYAEGTDVWNYGAVPTDGVHSLMRDGTTPVNSPINEANQMGSVNLAIPAPALPSMAVVLLVGVMLLAGSGLLRKRKASAVAGT